MVVDVGEKGGAKKVLEGAEGVKLESMGGHCRWVFFLAIGKEVLEERRLVDRIICYGAASGGLWIASRDNETFGIEN